MPICPRCKVAHLDGESHVCAATFLSFRSRWRAFAAGGSAGPGLRFRPVVVAWVVALALTSPLVVLTGDLSGPAILLLSFVAFPSGLSSWLTLFGPAAAVSRLQAVLFGWTLYAGVSVLLLVCTRHRTYRRLFILLCVLLGANIVGCYAPVLGST